MRKFVQTISWCAVIGTILPSLLFLFDQISLPTCHWLMLLASIVWFAATPLWMGRGVETADSAATSAV